MSVEVNSSIPTRTEQLLDEKDSQIAELRATLEKTQKFLAEICISIDCYDTLEQVRERMYHKLLSREKTRYSPLSFSVKYLDNATASIYLPQAPHDDKVRISFENDDDTSSEE